MPMEMQWPAAPPPEAWLHQLGPCAEQRIPPPACSSESSDRAEAASAFSEGHLASLPSKDTEKRGWSKEHGAVEAVANGEEIFGVLHCRVGTMARPALHIKV